MASLLEPMVTATRVSTPPEIDLDRTALAAAFRPLDGAGREAVLRLAAERHRLCFGSSAELTPADVRRWQTLELGRLASAMSGGARALVAAVRGQAKALAAERVPYSEALAMGTIYSEVLAKEEREPQRKCALLELALARTVAVAEVYLQHAEKAADSLPSLRQAELELVQRALQATGGNKLQAARRLGVSRKWLYSRLHELD